MTQVSLITASRTLPTLVETLSGIRPRRYSRRNQFIAAAGGTCIIQHIIFSHGVRFPVTELVDLLACTRLVHFESPIKPLSSSSVIYSNKAPPLPPPPPLLFGQRSDFGIGLRCRAAENVKSGIVSVV